MPKQFTPALLAQLAQIKEIDIETRVGNHLPHRRTIWIVVVENQAYIRSYRGVNGVWFKQIRQSPDAVMYLDSTRVPIHVGAIRSQELLEKVSAEYLRKYKNSRSAQAMILPETLPTTLRVTPR